MKIFDPIATPALRLADHLEPAFAHPEQVAAAKAKLSEYMLRRGRPPNVLVFLSTEERDGPRGSRSARAPGQCDGMKPARPLEGARWCGFL